MTAPGVATRADRTRVVRVPAAVTLPLFASTLFLSAFLMFLVEPMVAKMLLPVLGGTPMVWNTCVVFFQMMLLAGYGYAYATSKWLDVFRHRAFHVLLIAAPLPLLPFATRGEWVPPAGHPVAWLLAVLLSVIGLPFFVLATTASVLQHWFTRTDHGAAGDPYFLYVGSNVGSLMALAAYPVLVEPALPLAVQSRWWAAGYALFAVLACACAVAMRGRDQWTLAATQAATGVREEISTARRVRWVLLSLIPASLMLGVTTYLSTDIAAVPLMWIVPLAIYLLTFVIAFGAAGRRAGARAERIAPILVITLVTCVVAQIRGPLPIVIPLHLAAFAALALRCHCELANDRPSASRVTEFYFWISVGGMLGGLFNALVAPVLFASVVEYPLVIVAACACATMNAVPSRRRAAVRAIGFFVVAAIVTTTVTVLLQRLGAGRAVVIAALGLLSVAIFTERRQPLRFAAGVAGILAASALFADAGQSILHAERTFFGVHRVVQDRKREYHGLAHGTTLHGMQSLDPARRREPLTYFHRTGPFGQAVASVPSARSAHDVAVIGLGAGTLAAYARPDQHWTFYEIDPAVERIARTPEYFTYLDDCGSSCRVVLGDARLSLQRVPDKYDLIVLDAFSSDAIPMHLITTEALTLYLSHLNPSGVLMFHISNQHLMLGPVVARLAASQNLVALEQVDLMSEQPQPAAKSPSHWVAMSRTAANLAPLTTDSRWHAPHAAADTPLWTDDFSNILSVLRFR